MTNLFKNLIRKNSDSYRVRPGFCCYGIIDECMMRCKNCFKWKDDPGIVGKPRPSIKDWKRCTAGLRELVDDKNFVINFGGGEALLLDGLLDIVSHADKLGFYTNIASNGWLIDEEMAKRIADSGLTHINLSLDSLKEESYDQMRGRHGTYHRVMNAIEYLNKHNKALKIGICSVIYDKNLDGIIDLVNWVNANEKISWISFMAAMQPNNTYPIDNEWYKHEYSYLWPKDTQKVCFIIDEMLRLKKEGYRIGSTVHQLNAFKSYFQYPDKFVKKSPCNLDRAFHVSSVGDVFLCFRHQQLGNIMKDDIKELWHSEEAKMARENISKCTDNCHFLLNCFFEEDYPFAME